VGRFSFWEKREEVKNMQRILMLLAVALVVAAMAMPAFAAPPKGCTPGNSGPGNGFFASDRNCFHPGP
jgi:ABC-type sugar transport system substrate-binding protein